MMASVAARRADNSAPIGRQAILDAALRLYAEGDYSSVTMRAIALAVGCQSPSLYHYFDGKDAIFTALEEEGVRLLVAHYTAPERVDTPLDRLRSRYWRYYSFSKYHPDFFRLLFMERLSPMGQTFRQQVLESVESGRRVTECIEAGVFPRDTDRVAAAQALWCAAHAAAVLGLRNWGMPRTQGDRMAAQAIELALAGFCAGVDFVALADSPFYRQAFSE